jgi:O-antigen/teichoic acid export membrane protein
MHGRHSPLTLMGGRVTRDTAIYVLGTLVVGPFSLISVIVLTRLMAPAAYGELGVLYVAAGALTMLYNTGSLHGTFMYVYGASEGEGGDDVDTGAPITSTPRRAMGTGVLMTLAIVSFGTLIFCVAAPAIAHAFFANVHATPAAVRWAAVSAAAGSLWRLTVNVFRMERRAISFSVFNALRPLFAVGGTVPLVALGLGVNGALAGTAIGSLAAAAVCVAAAHRSYALAFSWEDARQIAKRGMVVVIPIVCLYTIHSGDIIILSHFAPASELGIYRVASRFAVVPSYFASAFLMAWAPLERGVLFMAAYREHGQERTRAQLFTYYLVAGLTIVLVLDVAANALVLLAGAHYRLAAPLIPLLGLSFVGYGAFIVLVRIFRMPQRQMLWYGISAALAAALDIGTCMITIPLLGAYGTAVGELVGLGAGCLLWLTVVRRVEQVPSPLDSRRVAGVGVVVLVVGAIQLIGAQLWPAGEALALVLMVLVYVGLLLGLQIVPRAHLRPLLRLGKHAVVGRVGTHNPAHHLASLTREQRALLAGLVRDRTPLPIVAERLGRGERTLHTELVAILRRVSHGGAQQPQQHQQHELDFEVGSYLLSAEPEAQRDLIARRLVEEGVDPIELLQLDEARQRLCGAPAQAWLAHGVPVGEQLGARAELRELAGLLEEVQPSTRRAALAILRDGRSAADAAAELVLPESVVAARVVRVLRRVGRLGDGGPEDVAVGLALFGAQVKPRETVQMRAVGHFYDRMRGARRRHWWRAGLAGEPSTAMLLVRSPSALRMKRIRRSSAWSGAPQSSRPQLNWSEPVANTSEPLGAVYASASAFDSSLS